MATLSKFFSHIYTITMLFFSIFLLELAMFIRAAARTTTTGRRSLTTEQFLKIIDKKVPAKRYKITGPGRAEPSECRVCLSIYEEGDEVRKLKCRHVFHKGCLDTWLQQDSATCPLCRRAVLPEEVVVKHRRHQRHHLYGQEYYDGSDEELMLLLYTLHAAIVCVRLWNPRERRALPSCYFMSLMDYIVQEVASANFYYWNLTDILIHNVITWNWDNPNWCYRGIILDRECSDCLAKIDMMITDGHMLYYTDGVGRDQGLNLVGVKLMS